MPKIYVGTYAKYASGSIQGKWFNLESYPCKQDFLEACAEFHSDEADPEFHFQDLDGIPRHFISESHIDAEFWLYMDYDDHHEGKAKEAYVTLFGEWNEAGFEDRFYGYYESDTDLAYEYVESCGLLASMPEDLQCYFDYERFGRDLAFDFSEDCGYYFRDQ